MSEHFHIGRQVICIEARYQRYYAGEIHVVKGAIYTIRTLDNTAGGLGLRFEEIVNAPTDYQDGFLECCYCATRFRPLRATDISVFTAMLAPVTVTA